jgi:hypothetical protein
MKESDRPEVFELAEPLEFPNAVDAYPPRPDSNGKFRLSELLLWFDFMDDVLRNFTLICTFFRSQLASMPKDAERARRIIAEIEARLPVFTRRDPSYIPVQQRCKDCCVMLVADLLICTGDVDCIQILSRYIAGSAEKWLSFSTAIVENHLSGQKDWREANSPAKWLKRQPTIWHSRNTGFRNMPSTPQKTWISYLLRRLLYCRSRQHSNRNTRNARLLNWKPPRVRTRM